MTDAEYEVLMEQLRRLTDKWAPVMVPNNWDTKRHFHRTSKDFVDTREGDNITYQHDAYCSSSWQYLYANLHFNMEALIGHDDAYLENVVVHEFSHTFLHELAPDDDGKAPADWDAHNEHATSSLAWAFLRSLELPRRYVAITDEY